MTSQRGKSVIHPLDFLCADCIGIGLCEKSLRRLDRARMRERRRLRRRLRRANGRTRA